MPYQHQLNGERLSLPLGKIVCVGRNYAEHAKELNNPVPTSPILFIKPASAAVSFDGEIRIPKQQGECHHELEMAVLIGKPLTNADSATAKEAVLGYGLGLDLTLRDVQSRLKEKGHPWEIAKSFDGACPLSSFVSVDQIANPNGAELTLTINGNIRQQGNTADMITGVFDLIAHMSQHFTFQPGDVVLTGTPAGVSALHEGDVLNGTLNAVLSVQAKIV